MDFKVTGKTPDAEQAIHQHEIQLSCYGVLYRDATSRKESGLELHHLVRTKAPKLIVTSIGPITQQQETRLFKVMESYVDGVGRQDFVPSPSFGCAGCEILMPAGAGRKPIKPQREPDAVQCCVRLFARQVPRAPARSTLTLLPRRILCRGSQHDLIPTQEGWCPRRIKIAIHRRRVRTQTLGLHPRLQALQLLGFILALRPPLKRNTANRPEGKSLMLTALSVGLGTSPSFSLEGITKAIVAFESVSDMKTGVVMEIFWFASFFPVMNWKSRLKLPSDPSPPLAMRVSTTFNMG